MYMCKNPELCLIGSYAPQGTVPWLHFYSPYTPQTSVWWNLSCFLQQFLNDSAIVGFIADRDSREYRELTKDFVNWYQLNRLQINTGKIKQLLVDFHVPKKSCANAMASAIF